MNTKDIKAILLDTISADEMLRWQGIDGLLSTFSLDVISKCKSGYSINYFLDESLKDPFITLFSRSRERHSIVFNSVARAISMVSLAAYTGEFFSREGNRSASMQLIERPGHRELLEHMIGYENSGLSILGAKGWYRIRKLPGR